MEWVDKARFKCFLQTILGVGCKVLVMLINNFGGRDHISLKGITKYIGGDSVRVYGFFGVVLPFVIVV